MSSPSNQDPGSAQGSTVPATRYTLAFFGYQQTEFGHFRVSIANPWTNESYTFQPPETETPGLKRAWRFGTAVRGQMHSLTSNLLTQQGIRDCVGVVRREWSTVADPRIFFHPGTVSNPQLPTGFVMTVMVSEEDSAAQ